MRYSEEEYQEYLQKQKQHRQMSVKKNKPNKYHNKKVVVDDIEFHSQKEAVRYGDLKLLEKVGEIQDLKLQPRFELQPAFKKNDKTFCAITYIADFEYVEAGKYIVEDTKGFKTKDFIIKQKLFEYKYPELSLRII